MSEIKIAAVGDILINGTISLSAKLHGEDKYYFDPIFEEMIPILTKADLTIGNLETPISGSVHFYKKKNRKTGLPIFNCPEDLAVSLKNAGFDILTTANNHCLDNGKEGLVRSLQVLDEQGIAHTGTFASMEESNQFLIREINGVRVGILAYTKHTNGMPIPEGMPWAVNLLQEHKIIKDIQEIRKQADLVIVGLHFGQEYKRKPTTAQKTLVNKLLQKGADIILGTHPHVLQPILWTSNNKFAAFSLGNFVSIRLNYSPYTSNGLILLLTVRKNEGQRAEVADVDYISTWTLRTVENGAINYRIIPNQETVTIHSASEKIPPKEERLMEAMRKYTSCLFKKTMKRRS
jgi:poly-gamma-glutamate capsule biosynthesis protein CapA/YwtB (metallophosphatase superfamily)